MTIQWNSSDYLTGSGTKTLQSGEPITWDFKRYSSLALPFQLYECKMSYLDSQHYGYGIDTSSKNALIKAFSEAWERACFKKLKTQDAQIGSTNGFAAGSTNEQALENSRNELIERHILLQAWHSQSGWTPIKPKKISIASMTFGLKFFGWRIVFFEINSTLGCLCAGLATHKRFGAVFDTSFSSDFNKCIQNVFMNLTKNILLAKSEPYTSLPNVGRPEDHRIFYSRPENTEAFKFLFTKPLKDRRIININNINSIETRLINRAQELPAVAYSFNPNWPTFSWGLQSIGGTNQWPHPLA